jgi:RNA polymerase sigma factor (sigma-70 family)
MSEHGLEQSGDLVEVGRLQEGEPAAWEEVTERLRGRLHRYFVRTGFHWDEADDLCQDALGKVYRRIASVRDPGRFEGWVTAIARNLAKSRRRRRDDWEDLAAETDVVDVGGAAGEQVALEELRRMVRQELTSMAPTARRLVEVRVLEGRSAGDAWLILGVAPEQQRRKLHLALRDLRHRLRGRLIGAMA